jgi:predicted DNA-binding transcriptional regulator AlpA
MERRYLSRIEAAQMLGLSVQTLANWSWYGEGPPVIRLSARCVRYDREELIRWVHRHQEGSEVDDAAQT